MARTSRGRCTPRVRQGTGRDHRDDVLRHLPVAEAGRRMNQHHGTPRFFATSPTRNTTAQTKAAADPTGHKIADLVGSAPEAAVTGMSSGHTLGGSDGRKGPSYLGPSGAAGDRPHSEWSTLDVPHSTSGTFNVPETTAGLDALTLDALSVPSPMLDLLQQSAATGNAWCDRLDAAARTPIPPSPSVDVPDGRHGSDRRVRAALLGWLPRQGRR